MCFRKLLPTFLVLTVAGSMIFAMPRPVPETRPSAKVLPLQAPPPANPNLKAVDYIADRNHTIPYGDTTALVYVGNFAAHHNGAVITADSTVIFNERHLEFFGNVVVNKGTTYIYGDRAEYNGVTNQARIYSPLVKTLDGDATLYTYDFLFNTLTNVGSFSRGGMLVNRDNKLESERGYYYADTHEMVGVGRVQMQNDTYELTGDSVIYDTSTDRARFFRHTNIWNTDGDYMYADEGRYVKVNDFYALTRNGYILTEKQELWSDSLNYFRTEEHVRMWNNIQIDETEHKTLAFGDYGEYWKEPGDALLTRNPSVVGYDPELEGDSLFMRADTMFLYTLFLTEEKPDSLTTRHEGLEGTPGQELVPGGEPGGIPQRPSFEGPDSLPSPEQTERLDSMERASAPDSLSQHPDSIRVDSIDSLRPAPTKEELKALRKATADSVKRVKVAARKEKLDRIARARQARATAKLDAYKQKEEARKARLLANARSKERARIEKAVTRGKLPASALDSLNGVYHVADSLRLDSLRLDSLALDSLRLDSLQLDSLALDSLSADSLAVERDTLYRMIKAYRNVKMFRTDYQTVCDSLVSLSLDSIILLYHDPVMWNDVNQISSDTIKIYTKNEALDKAEFIEHPIMISEIDSLTYNQVSGRLITAWFRDNEIYRNDVVGNTETFYYMQEEGDPEPIGFMSISSGDVSFYIEENALQGIMYRNNPVWTAFPMDKIPETQKRFLADFKWEADRRPKLADVFDRSIRPSVREQKSTLPLPGFPISEQITTFKKTLIDGGGWVDRDDKLSPETLEWLEEFL